MKILILLPYFLAAASACLEDSLIINGLINGRFSYLGHTPPSFSANSHIAVTGVRPFHEIADFKNHGIPEIEGHNDVNGLIDSKDLNSKHSFGRYNRLNEFNRLNFVGGQNGPNAFDGIDGTAFQSSKEITKIDGAGYAGGVDSKKEVSEYSGVNPVGREGTGEFESSEGIAGGRAIWEKHHPLLNGIRNVIPYLKGLGHHRHHWNWIHPTLHHSGHAISEKDFISKGTNIGIAPHHIVSIGQYGAVGEGGPIVEKVTKVTQPEVGSLPDKHVDNIKESSLESGYRQAQERLKYGPFQPLGTFGGYGLEHFSSDQIMRNPYMNWNNIQYQAGQNIGAKHLSGLDQAQYSAGHHSGYPISSTHQNPEKVITEKKIISKETIVDVGPHHSSTKKTHESVGASGSFVEEVNKLQTHAGDIKEVPSNQAGSNQIDAYDNGKKYVAVAGNIAGVEESEFISPSYQEVQQFPFEDEESALKYFSSGQNDHEFLSGFDQSQYLANQNQAGFGKTQFPSELFPAGSSEEEKYEDGYFLSGLGQQEAGSVEDEISFADGQLNIFQHPSFIGSQFLQPIPSYVGQYQTFGGLVPYPYPLPIPVTSEEYEEGIYPLGAKPVGGLFASIDVVKKLGYPAPLDHHHNHHPHHEHHQQGPNDDVTIFSRFEGVDIGEIHGANESAHATNDTMEPSFQQNSLNPAGSEVNSHTEVIEKHSEEYKVNEHGGEGSDGHEKGTEEHHERKEDGGEQHGNEDDDGHHQGYVKEHPEEGKEGESNITKVFTSDKKEYEHQALDLTPRNQSDDKENEIESSGSETLVKRTTVVEDPRVVTLTIKIPPKTTTKEVEITKSSDGFENKSSAQEHVVAIEDNGKVQVSVSDSQSSDQEKKEINIDSIGKILDLIPH